MQYESNFKHVVHHMHTHYCGLKEHLSMELMMTKWYVTLFIDQYVTCKIPSDDEELKDGVTSTAAQSF